MAGLVSHRTVHPDDLRCVAFHETGHVFLSWLNDQVVIHKISVIPTGKRLAVWCPCPRTSASSSALTFSGTGCWRCGAVELVFFASSTGAADNFQEATALAKGMDPPLRQVVSANLGL